jgi:glycosyltransferase involved in cell wall biosynthesis
MEREEQDEIEPEPAPLRLLLVTGIYPTADRPLAGTYVEQRVGRLIAAGTSVRVVHAATYQGSVTGRYLRLATRALTTGGSFDGVESHVLLPAGAIGLLSATLRRVPLVVVAHGSDVTYTAQRHALLTRLARLVIRRAAAVVANSRATAEVVAALGGEATVISPGVDFARFSPGPSERSTLNLPDGRIALFVGPSDRHKGVDIFIDGVMRAGWQGVIVGSGHRQAGEQFTLRNEVAPWDLPPYYRSVDCVVVPSRREGLGLVAIEALACGVPIVATRVGGLREVLVDGVNGVALEPGTGVGLARALGAVAARSWDAATLHDSVRAHDLRASTDAMDRLWRRIIDRGRSVHPTRKEPYGHD